MAETAVTPAKPAENGLRRREPLEMFDSLRDEMERLWGQFWPLPTLRPERRPMLTSAALAPRVDVFEKDGNLIVKAELPGVEKDDIQVTLDRGDLEIRGERKSESEVKEENYYRMERSYGSFYRRLPLGIEIAPEQIKATYNDGVLEITLPKPTEEKPTVQTITIT
jgi:HSP20 family protein